MIEPVTPEEMLARYLQQEIAKREKALLTAMSYVGERCLAEMRSNYDYQDQTGNLTSSKGYCIVKDGVIWDISSFNVVKSGAEGAAEGKIIANKLASKFNSGVVLIVFAGMNYAYYVSDKGYNVIDSAETLALKLVPQLLKRLGFTK